MNRNILAKENIHGILVSHFNWGIFNLTLVLTYLIPSYTCVDLSNTCVSIFLMDNENYENMHSILHLCPPILYLCFYISNGQWKL